MFGPLGAGKLSAPPFKEAPARDRRSHGVAVALAIVLIATLVRLFFLQALGTELAFITFYPAVMIAALYGGLRGGVAATLASAVIADYFLMMPVGSLILVRSIDAVAMSLFIGSGILVSWVADQLLLSQSRLRWAETQRADQLEREVVERTATLAAEIAERRQADANLLQATAILRGIGQNSPDPIYAKDVDGRFLYANPAVLAVIGKSAKAVLGHTDVDWHADPQQAAAVMANDQRVMRGGVPEVVEESFDAAGQGLRTFRSAKSPLVLDDGSLGGILCVSFDITQAKTAEAELQLAKAEAERASLAKSKFLAAASHDLRQPVQSLTLLLSMIKRQVADKPKAAEGVKLAEAALKGLSGLLTGILDISKLEAGVVEPCVESVDVGQLIERLAAEYRPRAAESGLSLRLAPCSLRARADREMVERILRNLLENALRYTPQGDILLGVRRRGENVRLDVIDTGIGIAANKQTEIFEEFRQLNNPARDASQGLGLGLAIVARLARLLGAVVEVASQPGRGSRFSLVLPRDRDGPAAMPVKSALDDCGGRILVIEDNSGLRQAYEMMLNEWGYTTFAAATGEEAIARAEQEKWRLDAIVADHRLGPGLTGAEAAAEIACRAGRDFPTLIVTGDTASKRIAEIHASGFAMLHKPVEAADLRRRLAQGLAQQGLAQQGLAQGMRADAAP
jgi:two-component system, sensor histidine kinase and response regulator